MDIVKEMEETVKGLFETELKIDTDAVLTYISGPRENIFKLLYAVWVGTKRRDDLAKKLAEKLGATDLLQRLMDLPTSKIPRTPWALRALYIDMMHYGGERVGEVNIGRCLEINADTIRDAAKFLQPMWNKRTYFEGGRWKDDGNHMDAFNRLREIYYLYYKGENDPDIEASELMAASVEYWSGMEQERTPRNLFVFADGVMWDPRLDMNVACPLLFWTGKPRSRVDYPLAERRTDNDFGDTKKADDFLAAIFGGKDDLIDYFVTILSLALAGIQLKNIHVLLGEKGGEGKTTLLLVIGKMFGLPSTALPMRMLKEPRTAEGMASHGVRLMCADNVNEETNVSEWLMRTVTGGGELRINPERTARCLSDVVLAATGIPRKLIEHVGSRICPIPLTTRFVGGVEKLGPGEARKRDFSDQDTTAIAEQLIRRCAKKICGVQHPTFSEPKLVTEARAKMLGGLSKA